MESSKNAIRELDLTGLRCPMPIVRINEEIRGIEVGDELFVTASDPAFGLDVMAWCRTTGHELIEVTRPDELTIARIRRST